MKILIIKTSALGDIIHTFPVVEYLKRKFPESQIDWVVENSFAEMLEAHPALNCVYRCDTKSWRNGKEFNRFWSLRKALRSTYYDVLFDFQANSKSGLLTFLAKAKDKVGFGYKSVSEWPNLIFTNKKFNVPKEINVRKENLLLVQQYFNDYEDYEGSPDLLNITADQRKTIESILSSRSSSCSKAVMVCPGSAWPNKKISEEAWSLWLQKLNKAHDCHFFFIWGTQEEKASVEKLQTFFPDSSSIVPKLPIPALQRLMDNMDLVLAMDSLPLHLAGTTRTATFSVFGASSANKYQPLGPRHRSYQGSCPYRQVFERRCPYLRTCKTGACIRSLKGDEINAAFTLKNRS